MTSHALARPRPGRPRAVRRVRRALGAGLAAALVLVGSASAAGAAEQITVAQGEIYDVTLTLEPDTHVSSYYRVQGDLTMTSGASFRYTAPTGWSGTDYFGYTICTGDYSVCTDVDYVVDVLATLDAVDDELTVDAGGVLDADLLANDAGAPTSVGVVTPPASGSWTLDGTGALRYTPGPGFSGVDTLAYSIERGGSQDTATVTIRVVPVASDDDAATVTGQAVGGAVLTNDHGTALTAALVTTPVNGSVTLWADGTYTYTPAPRFAGVDTFVYRATDPSGQVADATVTITVSPVTTDDVVQTTADWPVQGYVLTNDGSDGIAVLTAGPAHGTVELYPSGFFSYTPAPGFSGDDAFTYELVAGGTGTEATVTVQVLPVAEGESFTTDAAVAVSGTLASNDVGTGLSYLAQETGELGSFALAADGSFTYTPVDGATGVESLRYTVVDAAGRTAQADVTFEVLPVAVDDEVTTSADAEATANVLDNDLATDALVWVETEPTHGDVWLADTGELVYTPAEGWSGTDTFTYLLEAGGRTSTATVTVVVTPVAGDDAYVVAPGVQTPLDVLDNDAGDALEITGVTQPVVGDVVLVDGELRVTAPEGRTGTLTFTYTVTDASGRTATAEVTVGLVAVSADDAVTGVPGQPVVLTPLDNDAPTAGSSFVVESMGLVDPATGSLLTRVEVPEGVWEVLQDGSVRFTPASADIEGVVAIEYLVMDTAGGVSGAMLQVTFSGGPVPPVPTAPTTPVAAPVAPGAPAVTPTGAPLATTGADVAATAALAALVTLLGTAMLLAARRRSA